MKCACKLSLGNQIIGLPANLRPRFLSGLSEGELNSVPVRRLNIGNSVPPLLSSIKMTLRTDSFYLPVVVADTS